jgi:predicted TIM-barrel fold metal-dependent hydrolase
MTILDAHAHVSADPASAPRLLATMDAAGIARAIVLAGGVLPPAQLARQFAGAPGVDVDADNSAVLRAALRSEGRLIPFYFANPHRGADAYQAEGKAFSGLKLGPVIHGVAFDDPRTIALIAVAEHFGHPVYAHCLNRPGLTVADYVALARRFPAVRFMLGHAGIGTCDYAAVDELAGVDNVWFETSGGFTSVVAAACATLGALRVVFGGEFPLQSPAAELAKIRHTGLSDADQALVLGGSLAALLGSEMTSSAISLPAP